MLLNFDLAGAEWWVTAFLCRDPAMLELARMNPRPSPHPITGARMTGLIPELIVKEDKLIGKNNDPLLISNLRREHLPDVLSATILPRTMSIRQMGKKCLIGDTEVLTPSGWVKLRDLQEQQHILQWNNGEVSFTRILALHRYPNTEPLIHLKGRHFEQVVTKEHRFPIVHTKQRFLNVIHASDFPQSTSWMCPISGTLKNIKSNFSPDEARLLVAIQADGVIDSYGNTAIKLQKKRKLERISALCKRLGIRFTDTEKGVFIPRDSIPEIVKALTGFVYTRQERRPTRSPRPVKAQKKNFGPYLLQMDQEAMLAFVEELPLWDGHVRNNGVKTYFTTNENNAQWAATLRHLTGGRASITMRDNGFAKNAYRKLLYHVTLGEGDETTSISIKRIKAEECSEVFCLTVTSGFFMVRYNGKISITGNSNHGLNYREGFRTFALKNEIDEREAMKIVTLYREKSYPGLRTWYDNIDETIRKTRVLTNCFGRKVYFMGQLNDDTFRAATAFVPQSTVGDVTNHALPLFINDDSPEFAPAQQLAPVHDSLLIDYLEHDWSKMARFAIKFALDYLSPTLDYGEPFKLDVDAKGGYDWGHLYEFKLTRDEAQMARNLEECWDYAMSKRAKAA